MNISFKNIEIYGFQSIKEANINLSSQGIVIVKGINNYEGNASSNGSGKSSVFEAILFAIYGKTSNGITDPTNRYLNNGCCVKLDFSVDKMDYTIIRSVKHSKYKTGLILLEAGNDISGRNKTDTEKMIKNDILKLDMDIFLSTVFLSQGFSGRISSLTPSGRKERIETLTDTVSLVDGFKDKLSVLKQKYSDSLTDMRSKKSYNSGLKDNITRQINSLETELGSISESSEEINIEMLSEKLKTVNETIEVLRIDINSVDESVRGLTSDKYKNTSESNGYVSRINSLKCQIGKLREQHVCPTCGQAIHVLKSEELCKEHENEISELTEKVSTLSKELKEINKESTELLGKRAVESEKVSKLESIILGIREKIAEANSRIDVKSYEQKIKDLKAELMDIGKVISDLDKEISDEDLNLQVATHCVSLVSKQFRGYLLQEIINFMNARLYEYSRYLFSSNDESIKLSVDSSKLDIYLGDVLYDTLSGGEKKKVDIALVLTQRDLALNIAGFSCNILILDEILENLDQVATNCSLNMLIDASSDIESMFIISHNNYSIQSDSTMIIEKGADRVSTVSFE